MMSLPASNAWGVRLAARVYQSFLALYPVVFQSEYGLEMKSIFEERCAEVYVARGPVGIARWLVRMLPGELNSVYKEHEDAMKKIFQSSQEARSVFGLGAVFLSGTWAALFSLAAWPISAFSPSTAVPGSVIGSVVVLVNVLLVVRALIRSVHLEYVAGMAAVANTFLIACLMAVQTSLGTYSTGLAVLGQVVLLGLHGYLLWNMTGDDLVESMPETTVGG